MKTTLLFSFLTLFFLKIEGQVKMKDYFKQISENVHTFDWLSDKLIIAAKPSLLMKSKVVGSNVIYSLDENEKQTLFSGFIIQTDSVNIFIQRPLTTDLSNCKSLCIYYFDKNWTPLTCKIISNSLLVGEWHYKLLNNQLNCSLAVFNDKTIKFDKLVLEEISSINHQFNYVSDYNIQYIEFINKLFEFNFN